MEKITTAKKKKKKKKKNSFGSKLPRLVRFGSFKGYTSCNNFSFLRLSSHVRLHYHKKSASLKGVKTLNGSWSTGGFNNSSPLVEGRTVVHWRVQRISSAEMSTLAVIEEAHFQTSCLTPEITPQFHQCLLNASVSRREPCGEFNYNGIQGRMISCLCASVVFHTKLSGFEGEDNTFLIEMERLKGWRSELIPGVSILFDWWATTGCKI